MKDIIVREALESCRLADREVTHGTIRSGKHVLSARYAMIARLERFRRFVQRTSRVARISPGARLKPVIGDSNGIGPSRVGQVRDRVPNGTPRQEATFSQKGEFPDSGLVPNGIRGPRAIARFDRRRHGSFRAWLRTIVENLLRDFYRNANNIEPTMIDAMLESIARPTATELAEEKRLQYQRAVGIMRRDFCEKWVRCFEGIVIHDLSARELAGELGMTVDAVRTAKFKILKRLREEFGDLLDE